MERIVEDTRERILTAALKLLHEKGYKATTTVAIAREAGVNEVTLFRHFGNKQGIVEACFDQVSYHSTFKERVEAALIWDLEPDLINMARIYHSILHQHRQEIVITYRESFPFLEQRMEVITHGIHNVINGYMREMQQRGQISATLDAEAQGLAFICMHFGCFFALERWPELTELSMEDYLQQTVPVFVRGLRP